MATAKAMRRVSDGVLPLQLQKNAASKMNPLHNLVSSPGVSNAALESRLGVLRK